MYAAERISVPSRPDDGVGEGVHLLLRVEEELLRLARAGEAERGRWIRLGRACVHRRVQDMASDLDGDPHDVRTPPFAARSLVNRFIVGRSIAVTAAGPDAGRTWRCSDIS